MLSIVIIQKPFRKNPGFSPEWFSKWDLSFSAYLKEEFHSRQLYSFLSFRKRFCVSIAFSKELMSDVSIFFAECQYCKLFLSANGKGPLVKVTVIMVMMMMIEG